MRKLQTIMGLCVLAVAVAGPGPANAEKDEFLAEKCDRCHSVTAVGIEAKAGGDEEEASVVDLSHTGKNHDAAFFEAYLAKKADHVAHEGAAGTGKHKVKFKGSDEKLKAMAAWLASLK